MYTMSVQKPLFERPDQQIKHGPKLWEFCLGEQINWRRDNRQAQVLPDSLQDPQGRY